MTGPGYPRAYPNIRKAIRTGRICNVAASRIHKIRTERVPWETSRVLARADLRPVTCYMSAPCRTTPSRKPRMPTASPMRFVDPERSAKVAFAMSWSRVRVPRFYSRIVRLRLTYEGGADAPNTLILKTGDPARAGVSWDAGRQEVAFYSKVASAMEQRLTVRCYEAFWDAKTNDWRLLLEDLTNSHFVATMWPLPPTREQCEKILRALARFHAAWWDDPRLGVALGSRADASAMSSWLGEFEQLLGRFNERVGDRLPSDRRDLFDRWLRAAPRLLADFHSRSNVTISHGDAHFWNAFLPRASAGGEVRLFDWDSWNIDVGTRDLAYAMAMHWYPDRRRLMEGPSGCLPCRARSARRDGIQPPRLGPGLPTVGATSDRHAGVSRGVRHPPRHLVEQSRARFAGRG